MILIFGLVPPALVGVDTEAEPGSFDVGAGDALVMTFGKDGVDGGAIADDPPGRGFLSPPDGKGFLTGLATMLLPRPSAEEDSFRLVSEGRAVLLGGDIDRPRMSASLLGFAVFSVTIRLLRGRRSGVADFGGNRCKSVFGRFGAGEAFSSLSGRGLLGTDSEVGESAALADFGRLMTLGFRDIIGVAAVTVPPSASAEIGFAVELVAGVLILMDGALCSVVITLLTSAMTDGRDTAYDSLGVVLKRDVNLTVN